MRLDLTMPILFFLSASIVGCAKTPQLDVEPAPATTRSTIIDTTPSLVTRFSPASPYPNMQDMVGRLAYWVDLMLPPVEDSDEGPIVLEAYGFAISEMDYHEALADFLDGRARTPELEEAFQLKLRDQLMILRWFEESGELDKPVERVRARQSAREAITSSIIKQQIDGVDVSEAEIRQLYNQRLDQYRTEEMAQVRIILVPTTEEAQEVLAKLESEEETFQSLVADYSRHESRTGSGELEPFARGAYLEEFENLAFSLEPGETDVVSTPAGVFIMQKLATIPETVVPLEQVRDTLRGELRERKRREKREAFLDVLRSSFGRQFRGAGP